MPKGVPNKSYTGEFKQMVAETMRREGLSYREAARQFSLPNNRAASWERIYLEEGPEGLYIERRGLRGKPKLDKQIEEDLIAEVQRLRAVSCCAIKRYCELKLLAVRNRKLVVKAVNLYYGGKNYGNGYFRTSETRRDKW